MTIEYRATSLVAAILALTLVAPAMAAARSDGESVVSKRDAGGSQITSGGGGGGCPTGMCTVNGRTLTGIALAQLERIQLHSDRAAMDRRQMEDSTGGGANCPDLSCITNGRDLIGTARLQQRPTTGKGCPDWQCTTNGRALTGMALSDDEILHLAGSRVVPGTKAIVRRSARGGCEDWACGSTNGTQRTGLTLPAFVAPPRSRSAAEVITAPSPKQRPSTGGGCPEWACTTNGRALTGMARSDDEILHLAGSRVALSTKQTIVRRPARGGCEDWACGTTNGTQLTGLTLSTAHIEVRTKEPSTSRGPRHGCDDFGCGTSNGEQLTGVGLPGQEFRGVQAKEIDVRLARRASR